MPFERRLDTIVHSLRRGEAVEDDGERWHSGDLDLWLRTDEVAV